LITGGEDRTIRVWEARDRFTLRGHGAAILSVAFSPDGRQEVTGSDDRTARVWDVASGKELFTLHGHHGGIRALDFAADGQRIVTGSADETVRVWEAATPQQVALWEREERAATERLAGLRRAPVAAAEADRALLDFARLLGAPRHFCVAYAVCYLQSAARQTGLLLKVNGLDLARLYLNGNDIYRRTSLRGRVPDPDVVAGMELKAGLNVLVFKVLVEICPSWDGSVWLTDAEGQPVPSLRVTLDPDAEPYPPLFATPQCSGRLCPPP